MEAAAASTPRARRWVGTAIRLAIAAALLTYLARAGGIDWSAFRGLASGWRLGLLALAGACAANAIVALRLPLLLREAGYEMNNARAIALALIGLFFGMFLPGSASGDAAKIYYVVSGQRRGTRTELATLVLLDRAIGFAAAFATPLLVLPFFAGALVPGGSAAALMTSCAVTFAIGISALVLLLAGPASLASFVPARWRAGFVARSLLAVRSFRSAPGVLAASFLLSVAAQVLTIGAFGAIGLALGFDVMQPALAVAVPLGLVANALPITPGGLGVGEVAFHRLFSELGMPGGAELLVGWRLCMVTMALVGGALYVRGRKQFVGAALGVRS
jgi:hypothetical protein